MTHDDAGNYSGKHSDDRPVDPNLSEAVKSRVTNGFITCSAAFEIAAEKNAPPEEVGFTIDRLEIKLAKCQLGLFGHTPKKSIVKPINEVSQAAEHEIRKVLSNDRLSCADAWSLADKLKVKKLDVSAACDHLKIKISHCQLGAF